MRQVRAESKLALFVAGLCLGGLFLLAACSPAAEPQASSATVFEGMEVSPSRILYS
jgi:hypothetical protein